MKAIYNSSFKTKYKWSFSLSDERVICGGGGEKGVGQRRKLLGERREKGEREDESFVALVKRGMMDLLKQEINGSFLLLFKKFSPFFRLPFFPLFLVLVFFFFYPVPMNLPIPWSENYLRVRSANSNNNGGKKGEQRCRQSRIVRRNVLLNG